MSEQRVFMSYSTDDRPLVQSALNWLRESELRAAQIDDPANWGAIGDDVRGVITDRIRRADAVVLVWSDRAAKSAWVQYEVGMAQALGVPIRVWLAGGSQANLPGGLAKADVIKLDPAEHKSYVVLAPHASGEPSLSTVLKDLTLQRQRLEERIQELRAMLGVTGATSGNGKKRLLRAAARKRIAAPQKRR